MHKHKNTAVTVEVSFKTVLMTTAFLISLYLLFILKDVLLGLFISVLFATGMNPLVTYLEKIKIPRPLAILIVYVGIFATVSMLLATLFPPLIKQTSQLIDLIPVDYISEYVNGVEVSLENLQFLTNQLGSVLPVFQVVTTTFSGIITFITFAVITFYLLMERKDLHKHIARFSNGIESDHKAEQIVDKLETQIGSWVRGQLFLMFVVGFVTYIGLLLLDISYALPLAILAGLFEIIPNIGPTVSAVPAVIVPILVDKNPIMSVFVVALYILVQQLESNLLVPRIMKSAVGIHPLVTMILIIIGLKIGGIMGAILSVPLYLVGKVVFIEVFYPMIKKHW